MVNVIVSDVLMKRVNSHISDSEMCAMKVF